MNVETLILALVLFISSILATNFWQKKLYQMKLLDLPNNRSNHKVPTPRGGLLPIIFLLFGAFSYLAYQYEHIELIYMIILPGSILALISFYDDIKSISIKYRLTAQFLAVALLFYFMPHDQLLFNGHLPFFLDRLISALLIIWFMNIFNFMDGIDGLCASEAGFLGFAISLIATYSLMPLWMGSFGLMIFICSMGFLIFNWHPAKIFMGDVGSISLGFMLAVLLYFLASNGQYFAALILPLYFLMDSGITMLLRALNREKIWQAHSKHFYQRAVRKGFSHSHVVKLVILLNTFLLLFAYLSIINTTYGILSFLTSIMLVACFLRYFR